MEETKCCPLNALQSRRPRASEAQALPPSLEVGLQHAPQYLRAQPASVESPKRESLSVALVNIHGNHVTELPSGSGLQTPFWETSAVLNMF